MDNEKKEAEKKTKANKGQKRVSKVARQKRLQKRPTEANK